MDSVQGSVFAVPLPLPLFTGCKRRAISSTPTDRTHFFTSDDFDAFSVRGDVHESTFYTDLEARRQTIVTAAPGPKSDTNIQLEPKHLVHLLLEAIESKQIEPPEGLMELDNARRRVSRFSLNEHDQYLALQQKLVIAEQRGLPGVLALSENEMKTWQKLEPDVKEEQVVVCRALARALAAETAKKEAQVPPFVASWSRAMLTQCWNDVYRLYPRFFELVLVVKIPTAAVLGMVESAMPPLNAKEVAARGSCCAINEKMFAAGEPLTIAEEGSGSLSLDVAPPRHVISADPQAEKLMEQYDCDIAVSSSTLVTLFDSDTSLRFADVPSNWGIPMKSRATVGEKGDSKKRVYLDRPLPGGNTTTRDKIADAGRAALLSRFEAKSLVEGSMGGRVTYHVWQLEDKRILVRCTTHAFLASTEEPSADGQNETGARKAVPLSVFVKPDYRLLGMEEQLTTSERCRFWLHSWLRGGSTVAVARFNPQTEEVDSWKKYSSTSLVYGENAQESNILECFDPSAKLKWLSEIFNAVSDIPVGNCFIRPQFAPGKGNFCRRRLGLQVFLSTAEPSPKLPESTLSSDDIAESKIMDLHQFMTSTNSEESALLTTTAQSSSIVLPNWNLPGRIPYTFHIGSYCQEFFLDGVCPTISEGKDCDRVHLRLVPSKITRQTKRWNFEKYTVVRKTTGNSPAVFNKPLRVMLSYKFCGESKPTPLTTSSADLKARLHCSKPASECQFHHFTLHQLVQRVAEEQLRKGRSKRRAQKYENRQKLNDANMAQGQ